MLYRRDCRVCLDVILPIHITDAVKAVGKQCLKIPGTVDGCWTWLHIGGVESWTFGWWAIWELVFHWLCYLCCLGIWNDLTHLMNRDHIPWIEIFDSIWDSLERSQLLRSILSGLEKFAIFVSFLSLLVDGLERRLLPVSWSRVLKGCSDYVCLAMALKEVDEWSWRDSDLLLCFLCGGLPSIFKLWSWKGFLELVFTLFPMAKQTWKQFSIIHKWDLTSY